MSHTEEEEFRKMTLFVDTPMKEMHASLGALDNQDQRIKENQKIQCSHRHFETISVDYAVVTKLAEVNY